MTEPALATVWFLIICLEIALYIILDGADLGLGVLSLLPHPEEDRSLIMHTVGPIWDANETWLVIAGGTLFGAFPEAYAIILNALYIPVMIVLFGLILRAAAFEFHAFATNKRPWSLLFGFGSLLAVVGQGAAIGGLLGGVKIANEQFAGSSFDFLTPLTLFLSLGILASYAVVGYAYLIKKTGKEMHGESFRRVIVFAAITFLALLGASVLLPSQNYLFLARWTTEPTRSILVSVSVLIVGFSSALLYGALFKKYVHRLHSIAMIIFILAFLGMLIGVFPYIIPPVLTIYDAASSRQTQIFMLWGMAPLLPIVLAYNFYLYRVFGTDHDERAESYGDID